MVLPQLALAGGALYAGVTVYRKRQRKKTLAQFLQVDQETAQIPRLQRTHDAIEASPPPGISRGLARYVVPASLAFVGIGFGSYLLFAGSNYLHPLVVANQVGTLLGNSSYSPLLYTLAYAVGPLVLFPASLLTIAGGLMFGPVGGTLYTIIGSSASALVAHTVGRYFGQRLFPGAQSEDVVEHYAQRMRRNPFETVMIMRCLLLPYDLVSYLSGFLQVDRQPFLAASVLGALPGTIGLVLAGSSVAGNVMRGIPYLNPFTLTLSGVLLVGSLILSRYLKRRETEVVV